VVCRSSNGLIGSVLHAAGPSVRKKYIKSDTATVEWDMFAINSPNLPCKEILFVPWEPFYHSVLTEQTIKDFITVAIEYVINRKYKSIAFSAIGCGQFGLHTKFIAQTMVNHVQTEQYPLNVTFVIHPQKHDVFIAFQRANGNNKNILYYSS
jgi:hypothetical protein